MRGVVLLWPVMAACQSRERLPAFSGTDAHGTSRVDGGAETDVRSLDAATGTIDGGTVVQADAISDAEELAADPFAAPVVCSSQRLRAATESEGPGMMPGYACNDCHLATNASDQDDAPIFTLAGTVYTSGHEPDGCLSPQAEQAQVIVTDALGEVYTVVVNDSGNFTLEDAPLVPPFQAKIVFEGRERKMLTPQISGDCNSCHTTAGSNAAPGRIVLPLSGSSRLTARPSPTFRSSAAAASVAPSCTTCVTCRVRPRESKRRSDFRTAGRRPHLANSPGDSVGPVARLGCAAQVPAPDHTAHCVRVRVRRAARVDAYGAREGGPAGGTRGPARRAGLR